MKRVGIFFILLVVAACVIQAGSALKMVNLEVTPTGDVQAGDAVSVQGTVDLGDGGISEDQYLEFYTQLDRPTVHWEYAIGIDGKYPPVTTSGGQYLRIGGWVLSYPEDYSVSVKVTVDGVVPDTASGELTVFRARQLDEDDDLVGTEVVKTVTVYNPVEVAAQISAVEGNLAALKTSIDQRAAAGIGVGDAQSYYTAAFNAVSAAKSAATGEVIGHLNTAMSNINEANAALDRAYSQQSIDQSQQTIDSVIGLYNEFTVNRSLKVTDPRLVPITQKRDFAISTLSSAKDDQAAGSYASARAKAVEAGTQAQEAWNLSLDLKTELEKGFSLNFNLGGILLPLGIILIIVASVGGIYYYKKYRTWDELG
ncbi:MAG: hypothetical protein LUQ58_00445 [Methanomicrobiales archaeon]|nr:hypothetical protein [Methanomicrobiales archaeon]